MDDSYDHWWKVVKRIRVLISSPTLCEETDSWKKQTKPCPHEDPGERSISPTRDWPRLACGCPGVSGGGVGRRWPATGSGCWVQQCMHGTFWRRVPLSSLPPPWFGLRSNNREPIRTRPCFPLSQSLPSGNFHKLLILLHQRAGRMKTTTMEN